MTTGSMHPCLPIWLRPWIELVVNFCGMMSDGEKVLSHDVCSSVYSEWMFYIMRLTEREVNITWELNVSVWNETPLRAWRTVKQRLQQQTWLGLSRGSVPCGDVAHWQAAALQRRQRSRLHIASRSDCRVVFLSGSMLSDPVPSQPCDDVLLT